MYLHMYARMCGCMRALVACIAAPNASVCLSRAGVCVCVRAMRGAFPVASARSSPRPPIVARRARPHARTVRGRSIDATKVRALPESLGRCTLLEELCVPRPPPRRRARSRRCWRCAAARGAAAPSAGAEPRGVGCGGGGVAGRRPSAEPRARMAGARGRPARVGGGPEPPGAAARLGAQGRVQHRARGAAGGGRLAEVEDSVSARAAVLTRPRRCADAGSGGS
jgi:hypothetical protein